MAYSAVRLFICAILLAAGLGLTARAEDIVPRRTPPLEQRSYIKNLEVLAHYFPGEERGAKMQMMAVGQKRYLFQSNLIIDVSEPLKPVVVARDKLAGASQIQVAYNQRVGKWIAVVSRQRFPDTPGYPLAKGPRGVDIYDVSDPTSPSLLSRWATDGGDPSREIQEGSGTHRNYYDGGRYAYLSTAMNNEFISDPTDVWGGASGGLQIIDLSDPSKPKLVSYWHLPGQKNVELEARRKWKSFADKEKFATLHGPEYVPIRVEDGGRLGYGPWGSLGMIIHDLSDPANPKLISQWEPERYVPAGLPFHTIDVARLNRGFVITNPEPLAPQCREQWHDSYVIDVSDPKSPKQLATLPIPQPPEGAPYKSFCDRYGRFNTHNPPHLKAPGKPDPNFTCYSYFNAGLQCYDITDPRHPKITAYFVPPQGDDHKAWEPLPGPMGRSIRTVDNVFVEWDRKLIWVATDSGLYLVSAPALGKPILEPMAVREWVTPSINKGFDKFRPKR